MTTKRTMHKTSGGAGGGGINSKAIAKVTIYRQGYSAQKLSPGGVSQYGESVGNYSTDRGASNYKGDPVRMGDLFAQGNRNLEMRRRSVRGRDPAAEGK